MRAYSEKMKIEKFSASVIIRFYTVHFYFMFFVFEIE